MSNYRRKYVFYFFTGIEVWIIKTLAWTVCIQKVGQAFFKDKHNLKILPFLSFFCTSEHAQDELIPLKVILACSFTSLFHLLLSNASLHNYSPDVMNHRISFGTSWDLSPGMGWLFTTYTPSSDFLWWIGRTLGFVVFWMH